MKAILEDAADEIDAAFGKGYALANPGLIGAAIQTEAIDKLTKTLDRIAYGNQVGPGAYPGALEMISIALAGEGFLGGGGLTGAIDRVASTLAER